VDRRAVRVFTIGVRRSPLERAASVASSEQVVRAEIYRRRAERAEFAQQLFAVGSIDVVGLVGSEVIPDGRVGADGARGVDADGDGWLSPHLDSNEQRAGNICQRQAEFSRHLSR